MSKIFLDCGSNVGQGYENLKLCLQTPFDVVYMFEPNSKCFKVLQEKYPNFHLMNVAVWNKDEERILNTEFTNESGSTMGGASNILEDDFIKPAHIPAGFMGQWPPKTSEVVKCIDFSAFVLANILPTDEALLKLDIEGSEFEVLDKMIADDSLRLIKHIVIEWYHRMRLHPTHPVEHYVGIFRSLGIHYHEWT